MAGKPKRPQPQVGDRFGRLVVMVVVKGRPPRCTCVCDCGAEKSVRTHHLLDGRVKSCGCLRQQVLSKWATSMPSVGARFGELIVLQVEPRPKGQMAHLHCICDCGAHRVVRRDHLLSGEALSCGRHGRKRATTQVPTRKTHLAPTSPIDLNLFSLGSPEFELLPPKGYVIPVWCCGCRVSMLTSKSKIKMALLGQAHGVFCTRGCYQASKKRRSQFEVDGVLCRVCKICNEAKPVTAMNSALCWKCNGKTPKLKYRTYKDGAAIRGLPFLLTMSEFMTFWQKPCDYCTDPIETIGLDRVDNSAGYSLGNVTACCFRCNLAKGDLTAEEYVLRCSRVASHCGYGAKLV